MTTYRNLISSPLVISMISKLKLVVLVPHGNIYTFLIDANLWLNIIDCEPDDALGIETHELFHPVLLIKNLGIDLIIF